MRKCLLLICVFFSFYQAYAQSFIDALIVGNKGDSLSGCIRLDYSSNAFYFRTNCGDASKRYTVADIQGFRVGNLVYERNKVDSALFFLQKVVTGSATLYTLKQTSLGKTRYFLKIRDAFEELTYSDEEVVADNQRYQKTDARFLKTFAKLLTGCNDFTNSAWGTAFSSKVLINTVYAYNMCTQRNSSGETPIVYSTSAKIPVRFFVRAGATTTIIPSPVVRETKELYTRKAIGSTGLFGSPTYTFDDQGSRTQANWGWIAAVGLEQKLLGGKLSWGGQLNYTTSLYERHLLTGGTTDAYTDQYNYKTFQNDVMSVPTERLILFEGDLKERTSVTQMSLFARRYLFTNKSIWHIGFGLGYGLVHADYNSSIKLYTIDGPNYNYLGDIIRYSQPAIVNSGQLGGFGEIGWQKSAKFGLVAQISSSYTSQLSLLMNYFFSK